MRSRHRYRCGAPDVWTLIDRVQNRRDTPARPAPLRSGTRRRVVVGLDEPSLPVFFGDLPLIAPSAPGEPRADGCAAAGAVTPDAAPAVASIPADIWVEPLSRRLLSPEFC